MAGIAIIGAGVAGATVAHLMQRCGHKVTVFDKSRGSGGRISSRQTSLGTVDHGTPYFELTRSEALRFLQSALDARAVQWWQPRMVRHTAQGGQLCKPQRVLVGCPTMNSLTRFLLQSAELVRQTRITSAIRTVDGWTLEGEDGQLFSGYDLLVITTPPQQALPLLHKTPALQHQVRSAEMECCWVALVQSEEPLSCTYDVMLFEQEPLRRVVRHDTKPGRSGGAVLQLQASPQWSQENKELSEEAVSAALVEAATAVGIVLPGSYQSWAHLWRYGFTGHPLGQPCLFDQEAGVGVCGDWLLGRTVEDAICSALQMVTTIKRELVWQ